MECSCIFLVGNQNSQHLCAEHRGLAQPDPNTPNLLHTGSGKVSGQWLLDYGIGLATAFAQDCWDTRFVHPNY